MKRWAKGEEGSFKVDMHVELISRDIGVTIYRG